MHSSEPAQPTTNTPELSNLGPNQVGPEFIRIKDAQKIFGVKRGILYRLIGTNKIRSVNLRERGSKTGVRLIDYASLKSYLDSFAEGPDA